MLCKVLDISQSAYYKHKNRIKPKKEKQDELICSLIREYHSTFDGILGYRRMAMFINKLNHISGGFQYTGNVFKSKIEKAKMTQSMSYVGKCIDNGPMEGFFGILKSEMFYEKKFKFLEELAEK